MRHPTRSDAQDQRAALQFMETVAAVGSPFGGCPHVIPSMCCNARAAAEARCECGASMVRGPAHAPRCPRYEPAHDHSPWVTFTITGDGTYLKLDEHPHSRAAALAAVERNCQWGRVISSLPSGAIIVEHGDSFAH